MAGMTCIFCLDARTDPDSRCMHIRLGTFLLDGITMSFKTLIRCTVYCTLPNAHLPHPLSTTFMNDYTRIWIEVELLLSHLRCNDLYKLCLCLGLDSVIVRFG